MPMGMAAAEILGEALARGVLVTKKRGEATPGIVTPEDIPPSLSLVAGGHPISVVGGREDIMAFAEGVRRLTGNYVSLTGTFSGNPISCAVALAITRELKKPGAYEALFARGRRLMKALEEHIGNAGIPVRIMGEPPAFETWFTDREIVDFRSSQKAREWQPRWLHELEGSRLAVVGLGSIGAEVARLGQAFRMDVTGFRRTPRGDEPCDTALLSDLRSSLARSAPPRTAAPRRRMAFLSSCLKSALVLKLGISRPVRQVSSTFRYDSRSKRRLD